MILSGALPVASAEEAQAGPPTVRFASALRPLLRPLPVRSASASHPFPLSLPRFPLFCARAASARHSGSVLCGGCVHCTFFTCPLLCPLWPLWPLSAALSVVSSVRSVRYGRCPLPRRHGRCAVRRALRTMALHAGAAAPPAADDDDDDLVMVEPARHFIVPSAHLRFCCRPVVFCYCSGAFGGGRNAHALESVADVAPLLGG